MYQLYDDSKRLAFLPCCLFLIPVVAFPYGAYRDYILHGFNGNTVMFAVMTVFFLFLALLFFYAAKTDPYEKYRKWSEENPAVSAQAESEFEGARELGHDVWESEHFWFFKGSDFLVVPIGRITEISVEKKYRRNLGRYVKVTLKAETGETDYSVPYLIQRAEETLKAADRIAQLSGISVQGREAFQKD